MTYTRNPGQDRARKELLTTGKRFCLIYGGSRSGKTFELVGTVAERALLAPGSRHLIVRQEGTSAKRAIVKGTWPEMMKVRFPGVAWEWKEQYGYFLLENGSEVWVGGLNDDAALEKILGNEYATIYMNEASEIRYLAFTLLRSRLAQVVKTIQGSPLSQRFYVDLNPTTRQHWTYRLWIDGVDPESQVAVDLDKFGSIVVNPLDNAANLSPEYLTDLRALPERARRRFLEGKYVEDVEEALWRRAMIQRVQTVPRLKRIVVAIDPAVTLEAGSDETGLICAGVDDNGNGYVLHDESGRMRPEEWARKAVALMKYRDADRVVAEVNQGGDMVEHTIRAVSPNTPYRAVRATRSKLIRAEPVAALYERGKVFHVGEFSALEDQMCFLAGTLIETDHGQVPIEDVKVGEKVLTRAGYRSVEVARETSIAYFVVDIECNDGRTLTCTGNHPIFVAGRFVPASHVAPGDLLFGSPNWGVMESQLHGAVVGITGRQQVTSATQKADYFIARSGSRTMAQSLMECMSIIATAIRETIGSTISKFFRLPITTLGMSLEAGTAKKGSQGGASNRGKSENGSPLSASSADRISLLHTPRGLGFVRSLAGESTESSAELAQDGALGATVNSSQKIRGRSIAVRRVTMRRITPESVYNLRVKDQPEYFANGILAHNCSFTTGFDRKAAGYSPDRVDALVWAFTDLFPELATSRFDDSEQDDWDGAWMSRNSTSGY